MLHAFLAGIGRFSGSDGCGHMPSEGNVLFLRLVRNCEVHFARQAAVHLDEIDTLFLQRCHGVATLLRSGSVAVAVLATSVMRPPLTTTVMSASLVPAAGSITVACLNAMGGVCAARYKVAVKTSENPGTLWNWTPIDDDRIPLYATPNVVF